eukprot:5063617-Prymnesium_polylepis.1
MRRAQSVALASQARPPHWKPGTTAHDVWSTASHECYSKCCAQVLRCDHIARCPHVIPSAVLKCYAATTSR